jgi:ABC-2 type transport system permease protein
MRANLRFLAALVRTNLRASFAFRASFWMQALFMFVNNQIFFVTWWIFFRRYEEIGGWRLREMAALYGTVAGAWGSYVVLLGGGRDLARSIADGALDVYLTQPKPALLHILASRSIASGWGDLASAAVLLGASGFLRPGTLPMAMLGIACGAVLFAVSGVILHSLAFFLGDTSTLSRQLHEFVISFSVYPQTIYSGLLRIAIFTVMPAGLIGWLPVEALRDFRWTRAIALAGAAALYALLAAGLFRAGLRRYVSGSRFQMRV